MRTAAALSEQSHGASSQRSDHRRHEVRFRHGKLPRDRRLPQPARAQQELLRVLAGQRAKRTAGRRGGGSGGRRRGRTDHV